MKFSPNFTVRSVLLVLVSAPLLSLLFIQSIPQGNNLWGESLNAGHAVLFGVIAVMLLWTLKARARFTQWSLFRQYVTVGITIQLLGITTEFIQPYFHRDCELDDMIRDGVGAFIFLSLAALFNHVLDSDGRRVTRRARQILLVTTALCVIAVSIPADSWALAYLYRAHRFPVVAAYDSWLSRKFVLTPDARLTPVNPPAGWGPNRPDKCGLLTFTPARYPGMTVQEVEPDWRGYDSLRFDVFSTLDTGVSLALRIDDHKHDFSFSDRFNTVLKISPGFNHINIPLTDIEKGPRRRKLDLSNVARLLLFAVAPKDSFSVVVGPIELAH